MTRPRRAVPATGGLRGVVLDGADNPVEGAVVLILDGPSHQDIAAESDASGGFTLQGLASGRYRLQAARSGSFGAGEVEVAAGSAADLTLRLMGREVADEGLPELEGDIDEFGN